ncbi:6-aminohexanoate-oligomer exohydrolase [Maritalea myrionectae]|uniref:6-aminohexanoate-oligomer exohydrolase n=1 Tax=Maritalea myrionectae TaxID=454601 RepID=A0A2R4MFJ4_9HYPH|nr:serine hydrolase [Maritalea myrionectae]AVX04666.1 6-aminohexanoate-oligomer exohydrolase [Maritalea myrionectae]
MSRLLVGTVVVLAAIVFGIWSLYLEPKLTLFSPEQRLHHFAHMEKVFPSRTIKAGDIRHEWTVALRDIAANYRFDGTQRQREEFLTRTNSTSLLVIKDGTIVHEEYRYGFDQQSRATSFSVAKSVVATLMQIARQEGKVDSFDDPVVKYLPEMAESGFASASLEHVLNMSSGIAFSEVYEDESADSYTIFERLFLKFQPLKTVTASYGSQNVPGETFYYASINTQLLAQVLMAVYDNSLSELVETKLWQPLGMGNDAAWNTDIYGTEIGFMALNATPRDFARFGLMISQMGRLGDAQIVDADWIDYIRTAPEPYLQRGQIYDAWGYHHQWWLPEGSTQDFTAIGIWGQMIYIHPEQQLVIVKTGADPDFHDHEIEAIALFRAIGEELTVE